MPTALSDPSSSLYLIVAVVVAVTGALWFRHRSRSNLISFGIAAAFLLALFLIDRFIESPREEASRRIEAMAAAASAPPNPDGFVEHVSQSFNYGGKTRNDVRQSGAWGLVRHHNARVAVWGLGKGDDFEQVSDSEIEVGFYAKAQAPSNEALLRYIKARFVRDPDGQWRVKSMKFYSPGVNGRSEDPIPQFP